MGAERGPCSPDSGVPSDVEEKQADAYVSFMNIKFGEIGSTGGAPAPPAPTPAPTPSPASACCSWDGKYCGDTTDYCKASASQCADCDGKWCTNCLPPFTTHTTSVAPSPSPSGCPGGSLNNCIDQCPQDVFAACVESCQRRCASEVAV